MRMGDDRTPSTSPENATHGNGNGNGNGAVARRMSMDVDVDAAVQGDTLEPASGKAKDKPRLACQPCRLRRVKCERPTGQDDCIKCQAMKLQCVDSAPKLRGFSKGTRIAQAKRLYGNGEGTSGSAMDADALSGSTAVQKAEAQGRAPRGMTNSLLPRPAEVALANLEDADGLMSDLIFGLAKLKIATLPLVRCVDIAGDFDRAGSRIANLVPVDQALFTCLAALSARSSNTAALVGAGAPTLLEVGQSKQLREGTTLCQYGARRDRLAAELLNLAIKRINDCGIFAKPDLRGTVALMIAEMLIILYRDPLAYTRTASKEARPFSSAAASHLRLLAEEMLTFTADVEDPVKGGTSGWAHCTVCTFANDPAAVYRAQGKTVYTDSPKADPFSAFYSIAWTVGIRDALIASATGRALDFTSNDVFLIFRRDETSPLPIPSAQALADSWPDDLPEGSVLMQVWAAAMQLSRSFVTEIAQPLAIAQARLKIGYFTNFWTRLAKIRSTVNEGSRLFIEANPTYSEPEQLKIVRYAGEFLTVQAWRIISWRAQEEELQRAEGLSGLYSGAEGDYRESLRALEEKAKEEAFLSARRVVKVITEYFKLSSSDSAEFFLPGYLVFEGLLVWVSMLMETEDTENGGRPDYSLAEKIQDLESLRDAVAVTGWSSGHVLPHLQTLARGISELRARQRVQQAHSFPPLTGSDSFFEYIAPGGALLPRGRTGPKISIMAESGSGDSVSPSTSAQRTSPQQEVTPSTVSSMETGAEAGSTLEKELDQDFWQFMHDPASYQASLPPLSQPQYNSGGMSDPTLSNLSAVNVDWSLFSLDELNSASSTEWLETFLSHNPVMPSE